jgi:hypothetical protein
MLINCSPHIASWRRDGYAHTGWAELLAFCSRAHLAPENSPLNRSVVGAKLGVAVALPDVESAGGHPGCPGRGAMCVSGQRN